jgi:uncharacterized membrane protein YqhA
LRKLLESSKYLTLIAVISALVASVAVFGWGTYKTADVIVKLIDSSGKDPLIIAAFIKVMDVFLVAIALLIFALAVYELFIGELTLPDWLEVHGFHGLKVKLSSVIILVMAVSFLEHLLEWKHPQDMLLFGAAITLVSGMLVAYNQFGE